MKREFTCIVCPLGCKIVAELDENKKVTNITGNTCKRGSNYVEAELTNPVRMVTTTVRGKNDEVIAVKTASPIPKEKIFDCMKIINATKVNLKVGIGDVIIKNICGTGVDVISVVNKD